jgi:hypothetical protein
MSPNTKRRKFRRPLGERRYRKLFLIAVEGKKTEPEYFAIFNDQQSIIRVNCIKGRHDSSPPQVLKGMERHLRKEELKSSDEAWLVVGKDQWTDEQLAQLHAWAQERDNYGFALSNPKFEYWLLLHFEDGNAIASSRDCTDRLKRYLPWYDKGIDRRKITRSGIDDAIRRACQRDNPPCADWPRTLGGTTVYKLVKSILQV